jgi:hypothetical protein
MPTQINSQILKPLSCDLWENVVIKGKGATIAHTFHMDLQPLRHVQLKIPM